MVVNIARYVHGDSHAVFGRHSVMFGTGSGSPPACAWPATSKLRKLGREDVEAGGVGLVFGNCEPHLLSMNLSAGGRTYAEHNINSDEAGYLIPLMFLRRDTDTLAATIGSLDGDGRPCLPRSIKATLARSDAVHSASLMAPGGIEVRHHGRLVNVLGPGDVFGEMAFLLELPRQSDVYAAHRLCPATDHAYRLCPATDHAHRLCP